MLTIKILATLSGGKGELSSYLSEIKYEISVYYVNLLWFCFFFYNPHQYLSLFCVSMLPGVKKMLSIKILATLSRGKGELSSYLSEMKYKISVCYVNSLKPKISLVILLTICHTIRIVSVGRIWY